MVSDDIVVSYFADGPTNVAVFSAGKYLHGQRGGRYKLVVLHDTVVV